MALQRRPAPGGPDATVAGGVIPIGDEAFSKKYPTLLEFLTRVGWDDGQPREKGSFFVFCEDGMFKACLNDKDAGMVAFITCMSFNALLDRVEKGLAANSLDWRLSTQAKAKRR